MSESGEHETETTTEAPPPAAKGEPGPSSEGASSEPSSVESEPKSVDSAPISVTFEPDSSATRPTPTHSGTVASSDAPIESDRSWDDVTPARSPETLEEGALQWSASEVTVVT